MPASRRTPEQVRKILTSRETLTALAKRYGCSKQAISLIRLGKAYANLWPEIPRRGAPAPATPGAPGALSCLDCLHWRGGDRPCREGVPDASESDLGFANYCEFYACGGQSLSE